MARASIHLIYAERAELVLLLQEYANDDYYFVSTIAKDKVCLKRLGKDA